MVKLTKLQLVSVLYRAGLDVKQKDVVWERAQQISTWRKTRRIKYAKSH